MTSLVPCIPRHRLPTRRAWRLVLPMLFLPLGALPAASRAQSVDPSGATGMSRPAAAGASPEAVEGAAAGVAAGTGAGMTPGRGTGTAMRDGRPGATSGELLPFGSNLFTGGFSNDREDGLNPGYVLQPGDRVSVRVWGATEFNESLTLDPKGNVFLPSVGPIRLGGVRNGDLNATMTRSVATVFTDNVQVYASLDGSQPVAVFVTGAVASPGRFAGIPSNSVLHFIDRAGGIDAVRGSFRDIRVVRGGELLIRTDLYDFLRDGKLDSVQFQDGDTIIVGPRGKSVAVGGDVVDGARYEFPDAAIAGRDVVALARPAPGVSHVDLSGVREGRPFSIYVPLAEFTGSALRDGDVVIFRADRREDVIVVDIEGSYRGPSRYAVPRGTRLQELLDLIAVDVTLADLGAISIRRPGIAERQKAALRESLQRLEARYLTASSQTDGEAAIRAQEAQLIGQFVANAREIEPNGRLVVAREAGVANIMLGSGDVVTIPARSESVLLSGEVLVSQAMLATPGLRARDYIERSGGFGEQALEKRLIVVHANGEVDSGSNPRVSAGDEIIVLPKVPVKNLQIASTIVDILYKVAISASVAMRL